MSANFGKRLCMARGRASRAELARIFGVSTTTWGNWERGDKEPNFEKLVEICRHFGLQADWFLEVGGKSYLEAQPGAGGGVAAEAPAAAACGECAKKDAIIANQASAIRDISAAAARFSMGVEQTGTRYKKPPELRRVKRTGGVAASFEGQTKRVRVRN